MQACWSFLAGGGVFDEHLIMNGAARAAVAALCKNLRRDTEKVCFFIILGIMDVALILLWVQRIIHL
jgi:hypothetical protein